MTHAAGKDLLVYLHIPFCTSKCHFCDWVQGVPTASLRLKSDSPGRVNYIRALQEQIHHFGPRLAEQGYVPRILYWGGGTASILTPAEIRGVMEAVKSEFAMDGLRESTIECSPETLTPEKLSLFLETGFKRISIGIQALNDARLRKIGRAHDAQKAVESVREAREAGFTDINIDLISGFPDETLEEFDRSLRSALELPINHICLYPYRPARGTVAFSQLRRESGGMIQLEEQLSAYKLGSTLLAEAGFEEYAISHFGYPQCQSDIAYFKLEMDWIGFGSGATSLLDHQYYATSRGSLEEYNSQPSLFDEQYSAASPAITPRFMYQALSTPEGAVASLWQERTGVELGEILQQKPVRYLLDALKGTAGLIQDDQGIRLPERKIAEAFIHLLFLNAPPTAQRMARADAVFGRY